MTSRRTASTASGSGPSTIGVSWSLSTAWPATEPPAFRENCTGIKRPPARRWRTAMIFCWVTPGE